MISAGQLLIILSLTYVSKTQVRLSGTITIISLFINVHYYAPPSLRLLLCIYDTFRSHLTLGSCVSLIDVGRRT